MKLMRGWTDWASFLVAGSWPDSSPNNTINSDSEKRRSFVAPLFTAGYGER